MAALQWGLQKDPFSHCDKCLALLNACQDRGFLVLVSTRMPVFRFLPEFMFLLVQIYAFLFIFSPFLAVFGSNLRAFSGFPISFRFFLVGLTGIPVPKHLKKGNAACFYTTISLKLLIIGQICRNQKEGNFITINLTPQLSELVKYWLFYGTSKLQRTHFHCCSKLYWGYWPYWLASQWAQYLWWGIWTTYLLMCWSFLPNPMLLSFNLVYQSAEMIRWLFLKMCNLKMLASS